MTKTTTKIKKIQVIYHILLDLDIRICTSLRRRKEADLTAKDPWTSEELLVRTDRVFRILYVVVKFTFFLAYGCVVLVTVHSRGRH